MVPFEWRDGQTQWKDERSHYRLDSGASDFRWLSGFAYVCRLTHSKIELFFKSCQESFLTDFAPVSFFAVSFFFSVGLSAAAAFL